LEPLRERVRLSFNRMLEESSDLLGEIGLYGFHAGGKLLRPLVFLLDLECLGRPLGDQDIRNSLVFETVHLASLLHDDIVDLSSTRRGRRTAHLVYGVPETVLAGDFLAAAAGRLAVDTGSLGFISRLQESLTALARGALSELQARFKTDLTEEEYLKIIRAKTAVLFTAAAGGAAALAEASAETEALLVSHALNFGLSFQIVDDVLDYRADPGKLGKPLHQDLKEGRITLPFILARDFLDGPPLARLLELGAKTDKSQEDLVEINDLVLLGRGPERARERAGEYLARALKALEPLPGSVRLRELSILSLDRSS
jgi:octaprenyl-diphosphate synthase